MGSNKNHKTQINAQWISENVFHDHMIQKGIITLSEYFMTMVQTDIVRLSYSKASSEAFSTVGNICT